MRNICTYVRMYPYVCQLNLCFALDVSNLFMILGWLQVLLKIYDHFQHMCHYTEGDGTIFTAPMRNCKICLGVRRVTFVKLVFSRCQVVSRPGVTAKKAAWMTDLAGSQNQWGHYCLHLFTVYRMNMHNCTTANYFAVKTKRLQGLGLWYIAGV